MSAKHLTFPVVIPGATPQASAVEVATGFDPGEVYRILVTSPSAMNTGIAVAVAHQIVIPYKGVGWITGTGTSQNFGFSPDGLPTSGAWSVFGYNTNANPVTWNVYYDVRDLRGPVTPGPVPRSMIPAEVIYQVARDALTHGEPG